MTEQGSQPQWNAGPPAKRSNSTNWKALAAIVVALLVVGYIASRPHPQPSSPGAGSRCAAASPGLVSAIETGLTVTGGGSLSHAFLVRSGDFSKVYFVAARIEGPGMDAGSVGVWATNSTDGNGSVFAVDGFAREFSDWGAGPSMSLGDDGAQEARDCARG